MDRVDEPPPIAAMPVEEAVALMRETFGVDELTARFIVALERGEIVGDVVEVASATEEG